MSRIPQPDTVMIQEINSDNFLPLLSATKGMIMYPIKEPKQLNDWSKDAIHYFEQTITTP